MLGDSKMLIIQFLLHIFEYLIIGFSELHSHFSALAVNIFQASSSAI